jgi:hypothetical protein
MKLSVTQTVIICVTILIIIVIAIVLVRHSWPMVKRFITKLLGPDDVSSKRLILLLMVVTYLISHFLLMYIKIQIANKDLVSQSMDGLKWMIIGFGGLVIGEPLVKGARALWTARGEAAVKRAETGTPENTVQQNVTNQNVSADGSKNKIEPQAQG